MVEPGGATSEAPLSRRKKLIFGLIAAAMVYGVMELVSWVVISQAFTIFGQHIEKVSEVWQEQVVNINSMFHPRVEAIAEFDPDLGWRTKPNTHGPGGTLNALGVRSQREYSPTPAPGVLRIALFGDSFTYGTGVTDDEPFAHLMESADVEVLNYGVPGYGMDQALLHFRSVEGGQGAHLAVLVVPPVTIVRLLTVVGGFRQPKVYTFSKPRFVLDGGALKLVPNPIRSFEDAKKYLENPDDIRELRGNDYYYNPLIFDNPLYDYSATMRVAVAAWGKVKTRYLDANRPIEGTSSVPVFNVRSEAYQVLERVVDAFVREARAAGKTPVVVLIPDKKMLEPPQHAPIYAPLLTHCAAEKLPCLDASAAFPSGGPGAQWFLPDEHYTVPANQLVARWLLPQLRALAPALPAAEGAERPATP